MFKNNILLIVIYLLINISKANGGFSQGEIAPRNDSINDEYGYSGLESIFDFFRDTIFSLIIVVALGVFLFIGAKLIVARGKPDEFKKTFVSLVYTIVGILIVSFSRAIIKFASGMDF